MTDVTRILYPADIFSPNSVDEAFAAEASVARENGLYPSLLIDDLGEHRLKNLPEDGSSVLYRGWMLTATHYRAISNKLAARGITFVTSPEQYEAAHHLPGWVDIFKGLTPKSAVLSVDADGATVLAAASTLGSSAFIVKDYVKSRKHDWETACYAPTLDALPSVVAEFVRLQEEDGTLEGGIVIREFVELDKTAPEIRMWWVNNKLVLTTPHPDNPEAEVPVFAPEFIDEIQERVTVLDSPFVTTDVALLATGEWIVIEAGDGQVSGFPNTVTDEELAYLFAALRAKL